MEAVQSIGRADHSFPGQQNTVFLHLRRHPAYLSQTSNPSKAVARAVFGAAIGSHRYAPLAEAQGTPVHQS
jgi:hypothetical protein